ncbi:hypothetical protein JKF63_06200 [Porcisia hertigi]|uniref:Uncharacterized protein n=1 Tax=Porcisia hertigi TaxID=2761500 RepID=A0A836LH55_9TRYP|nr:hypothetical protein JKF63_06200 [Porcisia hertigi]
MFPHTRSRLWWWWWVEESRITTHYGVESFTKALSMQRSTRRGHSRYGVNCGPKEMYGQPVRRLRSYGIDKGQSRFAEVVSGRSRDFAQFVVPQLRKYFGDHQTFVENLQLMTQTVKPSFIWISADEVCYPPHILLRYEIERALVEGTTEVEDTPRVWNERMREYLGVETEGRDDIGCLQDIHMSMSAFGYFPTYTLGSMFAA